jgi:DNA-binding NarL/FixJ family response regulator
MTPLLKVLIAHCEPLFCDGFCELLRKTKGISKIEKTFNAESIFGIVTKNNINVLVLEDRLEDKGIYELTGTLKEKFSELAIVVITISREAEYINKLRRTGIKGLIHGSTKGNSIKSCLVSVAEGNLYYCPVITNIIGENYVLQAYKENKPELFFNLCNREFEFFKLKVNQYSIKEIMEKMNISKETAKQYGKQVLHKVQKEGYKNIFDFAMKTGFY